MSVDRRRGQAPTNDSHNSIKRGEGLPDHRHRSPLQQDLRDFLSDWSWRSDYLALPLALVTALIADAHHARPGVVFLVMIITASTVFFAHPAVRRFLRERGSSG